MRLTLTIQAEYAIRILVWLASHEDADRADGVPTARHKAAEIAIAAGVPPVFATRVLALLQRQHLLLARAGQQGGYTLARPASTISVLEVVEAVEGPLVNRECIMRDGLCGADGHCLLHDAWSTAREALRGVLARTPLSPAVTTPETITAQLAALREIGLAQPAAMLPNGAPRATAH